MTEERALQLLNSVVNYISVANNTPTQIEILSNMGFAKEDLLFFGYSQTDINDYYQE